MNEEKPKQINGIIGGMMVSVAVVFDLISLIPFVSILVSITAWLTFGLWFYLQGFGLINPKRLAAPVVSMISEVIPGISMLPTITAAVIISLVLIKLEGKLPIKLPKLPGK